MQHPHRSGPQILSGGDRFHLECGANPRSIPRAALISLELSDHQPPLWKFLSRLSLCNCAFVIKSILSPVNRWRAWIGNGDIGRQTVYWPDSRRHPPRNRRTWSFLSTSRILAAVAHLPVVVLTVRLSLCHHQQLLTPKSTICSVMTVHAQKPIPKTISRRGRITSQRQVSSPSIPLVPDP